MDRQGTGDGQASARTAGEARRPDAPPDALSSAAPAADGPGPAPAARRDEQPADARSDQEGRKDAQTKDTAQKPDDTRARTRRRRLIIFMVLLAVLIGGGGFAYWFFVASRFESTDDAYVDGEIVRVSPQIEGVLVAIPVAENRRVAPGDVLARIEPSAARAQLALNLAQLDEARTGVGSSEANVAQTKAQLAAQEAARDSASVNAQNTQESASRYQTLAGRSGQLAISQQQVDDAVAAARQAAASLQQATATVEQARAVVITAEADLATARAEVEAAEATVQQAQVQIGYLTLTAQIPGQVVQVAVNVGSYVSPGSQLMAIVPDHLYVTANYKETQLDNIRVGQAVDLRVDAYPEVKFRGRVDSIQRGAGQAFALLPPQNATGNFVKVVQRVPVRIEVTDGPSFDDYPIGPGMSVVPSVHIK